MALAEQCRMKVIMINNRYRQTHKQRHQKSEMIMTSNDYYRHTHAIEDRYNSCTPVYT